MGFGPGYGDGLGLAEWCHWMIKGDKEIGFDYYYWDCSHITLIAMGLPIVIKHDFILRVDPRNGRIYSLTYIRFLFEWNKIQLNLFNQVFNDLINRSN
jgi:hypothetical protein